MRDSLKRSLADSPVPGFERYRRGAVVLCQSCTLPIFKLERAISLGDGAGKAASALAPLTAADVDALAAREDIDAGIRGVLAAWTREERIAHTQKLHDVRAGDPMLCPCCHNCFVQVLAVEKHEALDRSYTIEMLTIPPDGIKSAPIRGRQLGVGKDWLH